MATPKRRAPVGPARRSAPASNRARPPARRVSIRTLALLLGGAVLVVAAVVVAGNIGRGGGTNLEALNTGPTAPATPGDPAGASAHVKGSADAPVTIVEYYDLQCPNCAAWDLTTEPQIEQQYIATGKVRLEVRAFPFLGPESTRAAQALEWAGDQGKFWEYRTALFLSQNDENRGAFSDATLRAIANRIGLDGNALGEALTSGRYADRVAGDLATGEAMGVSGTPTFFINGQKVVGNLPFAQFKSVIDHALAGTGG